MESTFLTFQVAIATVSKTPLALRDELGDPFQYWPTKQKCAVVSHLNVDGESMEE